MSMQSQSLFLKGLGKGASESGIALTLADVGVAGLAEVQVG